MTFLTTVAWKVLLGTFLAVLAEIASHFCSKPKIVFRLWMTVLAILCVPAVLSVPILPHSATAVAWQANEGGDSSQWPGNKTSPKEMPPAAQEFVGEASAIENPKTSPYSVLGPLWCIGSILLAIRIVLGRHRISQLARMANSCPQYVTNIVSSVGRELGLSTLPEVRIADGSFSPFLLHLPWGRSCIVLPRKLVDVLSLEQVKSVMRHELVHLRRRDGWRRIVDDILIVIWWWCPLSWLTRLRLSQYEELCVDREVVTAFPASRGEYARALINCDALLAGMSASFSGGTTFIQRHSLRQRVKSIVAQDNSPRGLDLLACVSTIMLLPFAFLSPQFVDMSEAPESCGMKQSDTPPEPSSLHGIQPTPLSTHLRNLSNKSDSGNEKWSQSACFLENYFSANNAQDLATKMQDLERTLHVAQASANTHAECVDLYLRSINSRHCPQEIFPPSPTLHHRIRIMAASERRGCKNCREDLDELHRKFGGDMNPKTFFKWAGTLHLSFPKTRGQHDKMMRALDEMKMKRIEMLDN